MGPRAVLDAVMRIFGPKRKMGTGEKYMMMNSTVCILHIILLG
jgi:hypothetical protein